MDLLQFTNPELFKSISLDQETLILESKDSKYTFHINFKDEIKGVDFYEIAIATQTSSGYINKSGTRREDLLLSQKELEAIFSIRKALSNAPTADVTEHIIEQLVGTKTNQEFIETLRSRLVY